MDSLAIAVVLQHEGEPGSGRGHAHERLGLRQGPLLESVAVHLLHRREHRQDAVLLAAQ